MPRVTKPNSAQILNEYLNENGIKRVFLAERLGITPSLLSSYLHGRTAFTADFAIKVSKALGISPNIFLEKSYQF